MGETAVPASAAGKGPPMERVLEGRSMARTLLNAMRALNASLDRVCLGIGYLCGGLFLMLAFFITYQSLAREFGWVMSPGTDQLSGYVMAMGSTWAFAYALQAGAHVRIDVLLPYMSPRVRAVADWVAVASIAFFVCITAWKTWRMALRSYELGAVSNDYPPDPYLDTPVAGGHRLQHGEPDRGVHAGPRRGGGRLARLPQMGRWHRELPGGLQYLDR